jgi:uncharacterized protein
MKVLCVSDHIDPLVYSTNAKQRFSDVQLVVSSGDLPMQYLGFISSTLNTPVLFVFGNHNLEELHRFRPWSGSLPYNETSIPHVENYFGSTYIGGKVVRISGLIIAGLGGSMRYNDGENQFTELQMYIKILRMIPKLIWNRMRYGRFLDILVTHAPPRGIHDKTDRCHQGFSGFRWFISRFKPRYHLHGHIHLYDLNQERITRVESTAVINVYDHYILEFPE